MSAEAKVHDDAQWFLHDIFLIINSALNWQSFRFHLKFSTNWSLHECISSTATLNFDCGKANSHPSSHYCLIIAVGFCFSRIYARCQHKNLLINLPTCCFLGSFLLIVFGVCVIGKIIISEYLFSDRDASLINYNGS